MYFVMWIKVRACVFVLLYSKYFVLKLYMAELSNSLRNVMRITVIYEEINAGRRCGDFANIWEERKSASCIHIEATY